MSTQGDDPAESAHGDPHDELPTDPDARRITATAASLRPLHRQPLALLLVFAGGVVGTLARHAIETAVPHRTPDWPVATFAINVVGAFVLGSLLEALARRGPDAGVRQRLRLLAGTGFCGAFTTYSTLALEAVILARDGHAVTAVLYGVVSVVLGALAAWAGIAVASRRNRKTQ